MLFSLGILYLCTPCAAHDVVVFILLTAFLSRWHHSCVRGFFAHLSYKLTSISKNCYMYQSIVTPNKYALCLSMIIALSVTTSPLPLSSHSTSRVISTKSLTLLQIHPVFSPFLSGCYGESKICSIIFHSCTHVALNISPILFLQCTHPPC